MATPTKWSAPNITAPGMTYASIAVGASVVGGFRAIYVGSAGNLLLYSFDSTVNEAGAIVTPVTTLFVGLQAGTILPCMGLAVGTTASGTTAGSLVTIG